MKANVGNNASMNASNANNNRNNNHNLWNRLRDAMLPGGSRNDLHYNNNENEPLINSSTHHNNHVHHSTIILAEGESPEPSVDYCISDNNQLSISIPNNLSCCSDVSSESSSSSDNSDDEKLEKKKSSKLSENGIVAGKKCIVDVPMYGSIQDSQNNTRNDRRRHHHNSISSGRSRRRHDASSNYKHYMGLVLTILSSVFSSLSGLTVKLLENDYHPYNICFWRFIHVFFIATCYMIVSRLWSTKPIWPKSLFEEKYDQLKHVAILMLRGILGCSGRILYIYSITCLTLADSMVIASSTPVFMSFFAYFLIGEACGVIPVLIGILTMGGVTIIARPPFLTGEESYNTTILLGTITGISGMLLTTLVMITMRKLRHVHHSLITMSFAFFGLVTALILSLNNNVFEVPSGFNHITIMYFSGLTSFFGQTFLTLGLKYEDAGPVSLLKNFDVIFAFIWEFIFLHVAPDVYSLGGGCLVIFCIILTTVRKWLSTLPEEDEIRSTFSLMLK